MAGWLLIITLAMPDAPEQSVPVGVIFSGALFEAVGRGIAAGLEDGTPGLRARWTCRAMGEEA